ncbi:MAG: AI-2E family transporter [Planctomycetota bacterium]
MEGYLRKRGVRLTLLFAVVVAAFAFAYLLQDIFAPLILGFLIAYVLDPFADRLEDLRLSRLWAVVTIFALATLVAALVVLTAAFYATQGVKVAFLRSVGENRRVAAADPDAVGVPNPKADQPGEPPVLYYRDANGNGVRDLGYLDKLRAFFIEQAGAIDPKLRVTVEEKFEQLSTRVQRDFTDGEGHFDLARALDSRLLVCFREEESLLAALVRYVKPDPEAKPEPAEPTAAEAAAEATAMARQVAREAAEATVDRYLARDTARPPAEEAGQARWAGVLSLLSWLLLCPLYVFFFLLEIDPMIAAIRRHLPAIQRDRIERIASQVDRTLSAFFRGRLIVCLIKGGLTALGLLIFGVPFWFPIGMAAGFLSLVPYVGIWLAILPAALLSWLEHESFMRLGGVGGVFAVMEAVEGFVLVPSFLGREVGLHPLTIVVTLLVFGKILGFVGVLLSVPLAAITKILGNEFVMPLIREFADERPRGRGS